jgi:hypothetical protein
MQKWEYATISAKRPQKYHHYFELQVCAVGDTISGDWKRNSFISGEPLHEYLNRSGQEGWEVVAMMGEGSWGTAILKRPLP